MRGTRSRLLVRVNRKRSLSMAFRPRTFYEMAPNSSQLHPASWFHTINVRATLSFDCSKNPGSVVLSYADKIKPPIMGWFHTVALGAKVQRFGYAAASRLDTLLNL